MSSGLWIVIEGIDASGKSEVMRHLEYELKGRSQSFLFTEEPGNVGIRGKLRQIVVSNKLPADQQEAIFYADRYIHMNELVLPALAHGTVVIQKRCACSTLVYQGWASGLHADELMAIRQSHLEIANGRKADHLILLDCRLEEIAKRKANSAKVDIFEDQSIHFQEQLRAGYLEEYTYWADDAHKIDTTSLDLKEVKRQVFLLVSSFLS